MSAASRVPSADGPRRPRWIDGRAGVSLERAEVGQHARAAGDQLIVAARPATAGLDRLDAELGVAADQVGADGRILLFCAHAFACILANGRTLPAIAFGMRVGENQRTPR